MARVNVKEKYKYLIGTKINKWTVLRFPDVMQSRHAKLVCRCDCGTEKEVNIINLVNGLTKDCGCGRKKMLRDTHTKNLVGQRFGKLTAVELLEKSNKYNKRVYRCKCDCGNEVNVLSNSLCTGHTLSCGCMLSYYNIYIKKYLDNNKIENIPEYAVVINDIRFRYDFYLPKYNCFIEYDGRQHYEQVNYSKDNKINLEKFIKRQEYDAIKNKYCIDNNINLLRIPYWEKDNIETIISNYLQRLNEKGLVQTA